PYRSWRAYGREPDNEARRIKKPAARCGLFLFLSVSGQRLRQRQVDSLGDTRTIGRIGQVAVLDVAQLDMPLHALHRPGGVIEQALLLVGLHQSEQITRLREVIGV